MNTSIKNIRKLSREYKDSYIIEEEQNKPQIFDMSRQQLLEYAQKIDKKVQDLQQENSVQRSKIWDLRKLIKRVAKEGYSQLLEVEKEKLSIQENLDTVQKCYKSQDKNSKIFEQCIAYWKTIDKE